MTRVGIVGVGVMGAPIARNILKGGFPVTVHDIDPAAADRLVAAGATRGESPRAVAAATDVVITMVPDAPDVEAAALGPDGILAGARPGLIYVDMSTIDPLTTRRVGAAMAVRGVRMIDCPVGRTTAHAEVGRLLLMLGGDPGDIEAVRPVLACTADTFIYCGRSTTCTTRAATERCARWRTACSASGSRGSTSPSFTTSSPGGTARSSSAASGSPWKARTPSSPSSGGPASCGPSGSASRTGTCASGTCGPAISIA
jgi:NAD binding domain of 6-phosphogluconate dehydrogenase